MNSRYLSTMHANYREAQVRLQVPHRESVVQLDVATRAEDRVDARQEDVGNVTAAVEVGPRGDLRRWSNSEPARHADGGRDRPEDGRRRRQCGGCRGHQSAATLRRERW